MPAIELTSIPYTTANGLQVQRLVIALTTLDKLVNPEDLKRLEWKSRPQPGIGVILDGRAPNWVFAALAPLCLPFNVPWIATYEPRLHAAVIVHCNDPGLQPGDLVDLGKSIPQPSESRECLLNVKDVAARNSVHYQRLAIFVPEGVNTAVLKDLTLPLNLDLTRGVVLWGKAPVWLYTRLTLLARNAPWVGTYNKPLASFVIVAGQSAPGASLGDAFHLVTGPACPAILIGGPPNSGKSVLANALAIGLKRKFGPEIHMQRAHADGEGDWFVQMYANVDLQARAMELRHAAKAKYTDRFFLHHAAAVQNARETSRLVLVDFGGVPNNEDVTLLHRCTHYILISSRDDALPEWHNFCTNRGGLQCLAVIHSTLDAKLEILQRTPYLELIAGPWHRGEDKLPNESIEVVIEHASALGISV